MKPGFPNFRPLQKNISTAMETFIIRLQASGPFPGKQEKTVPAMSGFVHPSQKHKSLFDIFLWEKRFYEADKTGQPGFYLSEIVFFLSEIVYIPVCYIRNGCTTFAVSKIHKK
jgi:hypothetical protein